jgi:hypothetical protein
MGGDVIAATLQQVLADWLERKDPAELRHAVLDGS